MPISLYFFAQFAQEAFSWPETSMDASVCIYSNSSVFMQKTVCTLKCPGIANTGMATQDAAQEARCASVIVYQSYFCVAILNHEIKR